MNMHCDWAFYLHEHFDFIPHKIKHKNLKHYIISNYVFTTYEKDKMLSCPKINGAPIYFYHPLSKQKNCFEFEYF